MVRAHPTELSMSPPSSQVRFTSRENARLGLGVRTGDQGRVCNLHISNLHLYFKAHDAHQTSDTEHDAILFRCRPRCPPRAFGADPWQNAVLDPFRPGLRLLPRLFEPPFRNWLVVSEDRSHISHGSVRHHSSSYPQCGNSHRGSLPSEAGKCVVLSVPRNSKYAQWEGELRWRR